MDIKKGRADRVRSYVLLDKTIDFLLAVFCAGLWFWFGQIVLINEIVDLLAGVVIR